MRERALEALYAEFSLSLPCSHALTIFLCPIRRCTS